MTSGRPRGRRATSSGSTANHWKCRTSAVRERLTQLGFHVDGRGAAAYRAYIRSEAERWTPVIRSLGIKAD